MASLNFVEMARVRKFVVELDGISAALVVQGLALLDSEIGRKVRHYDETPIIGSKHFQGILRADALVALETTREVEKALRQAIAADEEHDARFSVVGGRRA